MPQPHELEPLGALVVNPGDQVLICLRDQITHEYAHRMSEQLKAQFPDVAFTIVCGVTSVLVQPT